MGYPFFVQPLPITDRGAPSFAQGAPRRGEAREAVKLLILASFTTPLKLSFVKLPEAEDLGQVHSFFAAF